MVGNIHWTAADAAHVLSTEHEQREFLANIFTLKKKPSWKWTYTLFIWNLLLIVI